MATLLSEYLKKFDAQFTSLATIDANGTKTHWGLLLFAQGQRQEKSKVAGVKNTLEHASFGA